AGLPDADDARAARPALELGPPRRLDPRRVVRVDADGGEDVRLLLGEVDGAADLPQVLAGADGDEALDAGRAGAGQDLGPVLVEALAVDVAVAVDEPHDRPPSRARASSASPRTSARRLFAAFARSSRA